MYVPCITDLQNFQIEIKFRLIVKLLFIFLGNPDYPGPGRGFREQHLCSQAVHDRPGGVGARVGHGVQWSEVPGGQQHQQELAGLGWVLGFYLSLLVFFESLGLF